MPTRPGIEVKGLCRTAYRTMMGPWAEHFEVSSPGDDSDARPGFVPTRLADSSECDETICSGPCRRLKRAESIAVPGLSLCQKQIEACFSESAGVEKQFSLVRGKIVVNVSKATL